MARPDNPQLDDRDVEEIRRARADIAAGRLRALRFEYVDAELGRDEFTDYPLGPTRDQVASGVVSLIEDEDLLLRHAGKARKGDLKVTMSIDDALAIGLDRIRGSVVTFPSPSGTRHLVDVLVEEGLGAPSRVEMALVRE